LPHSSEVNPIEDLKYQEAYANEKANEEWGTLEMSHILGEKIESILSRSVYVV